MQQTIKKWLDRSLAELRDEGLIAGAADARVVASKQKAHGDYTSSVALALAERSNTDARSLAAKIVERLPTDVAVEKIEVAGPGFINFHLGSNAEKDLLSDMLTAIAALGERYGCSWVEDESRALVEFVSANPTGPLHVGHGRGLAYGETIAAMLEAAGYEVEREYYVNDAGRQMDILAASVWLRYLELGGEEIDFPRAGYHGDYIWDIAAEVRRTYGDSLHHPFGKVCASLSDGGSPDEPEAAEKQIDGLISNCKQLLDDAYGAVADISIKAMLDNIRAELRDFGVGYDRWFSEKELFTSGEIEKAVSVLRDKGHLYERDGAVWFRASAFGDEKDRVVERAGGQKTYFASDIAYHLNKFERGYDLIVNVWGADHHGYLPRLHAAIEALGLDTERMKVVLVQFASLYRNGVKVPMSTRSGRFVPLRELREEVGRDAARFFYVMRKPSQHMDFDITLAKSESNDNPVYYIQYAHARICNVFRELEERCLGLSPDVDAVAHLTGESEKALLRRLSQYRDVLVSATVEMAPHILLNFLRELAAEFHSYYNGSRFLVDDDDVRSARLVLAGAVRQLFANGLGLLGVSAPQRM